MKKKLQKFRYFWSQIQKLIVIKLFVSLLRFALSVVTARYLGAEGRGILFSLQNVVGLVVTGACLSIGEAITYFWNKDQISLNSLWKLHWYASILFGVITGTSTLITTWLIFGDGTISKHLIGLVTLLAIVSAHEYLLMSVLKARMRFVAANVLFLIVRLSTLLFVLVSGPDLTTITSVIIAYIVFSVLGAFGCFVIAKPFTGSLKKNVNKRVGARPFLAYAVKSHAGTILNQLENRIDLLILARWANFGDIGVYSISLALVQLLNYLSNSVGNVLFPFIIKEKEGDTYFSEISKVTIAITIVFSLLLLVVSEMFVSLVFGAEYVKASEYIAVLLFASFCDIIGRLAAVWMKAQNYLDPLNRISFLTLTLNVSLNLYFIPKYGIWAAIAVSCFTYLLRAVFSIWFIWLHRGPSFLVAMIPQPRDLVGITMKILRKTRRDG